jgi:hypothetical protein
MDIISTVDNGQCPSSLLRHDTRRPVKLTEGVTLLVCVREVPVQTSAGTSIILIEILYILPQSIQTNTATVPLIRLRPLPTTSFPNQY